jgi:hypothetical protein
MLHTRHTVEETIPWQGTHNSVEGTEKEPSAILLYGMNSGKVVLVLELLVVHYLGLHRAVWWQG